MEFYIYPIPYILIAGRDGFPAPASQLLGLGLGTSASDPLRETVASPDMAQGSQGEENATKNFPPKKYPPYMNR